MFSPQLGNFPFATTKIKQDNSISSNLPNISMDTNNGAGDSNQSLIDKTKLIVNYIPQFATEDDLALIFAPIGRIESVKIMRDFKTGYSFGFGFVKYSTPEDAAKAIEVLNGYNFRNKRLKVSYSRPPGTAMKDSNLYITNLPKDITEQQIDNLFCEFGEIVQRTVLKDKVTGMPRGVAFVRFSRGEEAQAAIANMHGKMLENAMLPLSVRVAEDHGRQKAQYVDMWDPMGFNRELDYCYSEDTEQEDPEEMLISYVFSRRPLWDCNVPLSERTQMKIDTLWEDICYKFDGRYSVEFIIKKWHQLKNDYFLARKKVITEDSLARPTFPYYDHMRFLDDITNIDMLKSKLLAPTREESHPITALEEEGNSVKRLRLENKKESQNGVDGFLLLLGEGLRQLPLKTRTRVQIKILQLLEEEQTTVELSTSDTS